jgi:predicted ATPase with chaperone activity
MVLQVLGKLCLQLQYFTTYDFAEALETTKIQRGKLKWLMNQRPFRSPHHTISNVALVGGGLTR